MVFSSDFNTAYRALRKSRSSSSSKGCIFMRARLKDYAIIILSFILAMILTIIPTYQSVAWIKPNFIVLCLIYWVIAKPKIVGIYFAFFLGIYLDLLLNNTLGLTSLSLIIILYFSNFFKYKLSTTCLWQQALMILFLCGLYKIILFFEITLVKNIQITIHYWFSLIISVLFWPLINLLLRNYCRLFKIS